MKEVIRKVGDEWVLYSKDGLKVLGRFKSKKAALAREEEIKQIVAMGEQSMKVKVKEDFYDAFRTQFPESDVVEMTDTAYVVEVMKDYVIVRQSKDDKHFRVPYKWESDKPVFEGRSEWVEVEQRYIPLTENLTILEAKATENGEGREWEVVIIGPDGDGTLVDIEGVGYVRSQNGRFYNTGALEESVPLWDGIKVYDNHLTDEEFDAKQGMRSVVEEWVGVITDPWWDKATNSVKGVLKIVDEGLRSKLKNAWEAGVLDKIGLSIDAMGTGRKSPAGQLVEKLTRAMSVDVVADPAAGGRLARMIASAQLSTEDTMREEFLKLLEELLGDKFEEMKEALEAMTDEKLESFVTAITPEPVVEDDPEPVDEADVEDNSEAESILEEAKRILAEAKDERRMIESGNMLHEKLEGSGLPAEMRSIIVDRFEKKIFEETEIDAAITQLQGVVDSMSESGSLNIPVREGIRTEGTLDAEDNFAVGLIDLMAENKEEAKAILEGYEDIAGEAGYPVEDFRHLEAYKKAGRPNNPSWRGLADWYIDYCGGYDAALAGRSVRRLREAAVTTSSMTSIIKNTLNLFLAHSYGQREQWWAPIVRNLDVNNLDDATLVRTYGFAVLPVVSEGATYTEGQWADQEETASYVKKGRFIGVTLEMLLQDKLNKLREIPRLQANAWYNTISELVATVFTCNSNTGPVLTGDGGTGALFNATALTSTGGHANLLTTALSSAAYKAARLAMMKQTDRALGAGRRLMIQPKFMLVPPDLELTAQEILNSELVPHQNWGSGTDGQTINVLRRRFQIISVPDWTDATDWALLADPAQHPVIWLIWVRGRRTPELISATAEGDAAFFTNDTLRYKVRQFCYQFSSTYTCAPVSDWKGVHKSNVAG
jgi:hypothetical protein